MSKRSQPQIHVWRPPSAAGVEFQWCHDVTMAVPVHFHDGYQLGLVLGGALEVAVAGRVECAEVGDLVLIDAAEPHAMSGSPDTPVTAVVVEVAQSRMRDCLGLAEGQALPRFEAAVVRDEAAADALAELHQALSDGDATKRENGFGQLDALLGHLVVEHARPGLDAPDDVRAEAVDRVRAYLDEHVGDKPSLDALARSVGASKFQLIRCFKRRVGVPPLGYQMQRRINRAKEMLAGGRPIVDVAFALGFADQSHFTRHFRRLTLMTPGDYQRSQKPQ